MPSRFPFVRSAEPFRVLVTGATGLVGRALVPELRGRGWRVTSLVRQPGPESGDLAWNARERTLVFPPGMSFDAVIHLAGENIAVARWTAERCAAIRESRVAGTRNLVEALTQLPVPPRVLVSASAIGYYGDRGDERLTEAAPPGSGFLADTCVALEREAAAASAALGARVVIGRFGLVLAPGGGALKKMLPAFRAGFGGPLGDGRQWMSWVSIADLVAMLIAAIGDPRWSGPVNLVAPAPVTNAAFTTALARAVGRPAFLPVPRWVLRARFGRMADEALLASTRVMPAALNEQDFRYAHPELESALRAALA